MLAATDVDLDLPGILAPGAGQDWNSQDTDRLRVLALAIAMCRVLAESELELGELASCVGVDQRTCRRYVYALQRAGLDIIVRRRPGHGHAYRLDPRSWHGLLYLPLD